MNTFQSLRLAGLLAVVVVSYEAVQLLGGDAVPRQAIKGTITLDGQPIDGGVIRFIATKHGEVDCAGSIIDAGKYDIPQPQGLIPARYRVLISGLRETARKADRGELGSQPAPVEPIPSKYNSESTLMIDVIKGGDCRFDFNLER